MPSGLIALLDDVAAIAQVAASALDDAAGLTAKAGAKAAGVVIDDAAVTPRYVTGFAAARELPIVGKIALGSLRNKLLYLLPAGLALSAVAPWAISPLLMAGGAYLCFEGAEKLYEKIVPHDAGHAPEAPEEAAMVAGAIRTDLILSGEIMAITLASVAGEPIASQAIVLTLVGVAITALVYGAVALIVKADDAGVVFARTGSAPVRAIGRALVTGMPKLLGGLAAVGTAAMLWVGGGIVVHGLDGYGVHAPAAAIHSLSDRAGDVAGPVAAWLAGAVGAGVVGVLVGAVVVAALALWRRR